jgi:two-component system osmolarity sensor histidine kinase EnvZ
MMPTGKGRATLFRSTAVTVAAALIVLQLVMLAAIAYYIMLPMARRSADDLAALIVLSAQTWVELPPQTRPDFELELAAKHNLWLLETAAELPGHDRFLPYLSLLERALEKRMGEPVGVKITEWEKTWFWAEIRTGGTLIRVGFPADRLGVQPPLALLLVLAATVVLTLVTAIILARRVARPLERLSVAAGQVGQGSLPDTLPETGPEELANLARAFNRMALQVRELLANRTTLLAGISHDLRTPLARMRLAVEMLPDDADPKLLARLHNDLGEMNRLIGEFIDFSRGLEKETPQPVDLGGLLREFAHDVAAGGTQIECRAPDTCIRALGVTALRRILSNLLGNALRYGAGQPVVLELSCGEKNAVVSVLDRGPGIPPDEVENVFRPFYRLESSRSAATGGSGLGLAIARQLADANGWKIELLPREGGGTEARLRLD